MPAMTFHWIPAHRWDFRVEAATAHLEYLPGYEQQIASWQTGVGGGLSALRAEEQEFRDHPALRLWF